MKKPILIIYFFILLVSCRKGAEVNSIENELDKNAILTLSEAKKYLNASETINDGSYIEHLVVDSAKQIKSGGYFFWNRAKIYNKSNLGVIEVPVAYQIKKVTLYNLSIDSLVLPSDQIVFKASFSRMIITKNPKTGSMQKAIITYIPDRSYLNEHKLDASSVSLNDTKRFTGYVEYRSWGGKVMFIVRVKTGRTIREHFTKQALGAKRLLDLKKPLYWAESCIEDMVEVCSVSSDGLVYGCDTHPNGTYTCTSYWIDLPDNPPSNDYPMPGGGNDSWGTVVTGVGLSSASQQNNPRFNNNADKECLDAIVEKVLTTSQFNVALREIASGNMLNGANQGNPYPVSVAAMINNISNSTNWNVSIYNAYLPQVVDAYGVPMVDGNGDPVIPNASTNYDGHGGVKITLDNNYLSTASELAVARTFIHEAIHAYFQFGRAYGGAEFEAVYKYLFDKNGNPVYDQNSAQHEEMATMYISEVSALLAFYAMDKGITSPDPNQNIFEYCKDLAWGGLSDTNAYRSYATNKNRIERHLKNEVENNSQSTNRKACP